MLSHLPRASARANSSLAASRRALASRLLSTQAADTSKRRDENPRAIWTAFIRVWRPPTGVSEALLILAEIEKKYGKIRESHFFKDYEVPQKYQMMAMIVFEDPQSVESIPRGGVDHAVESPLLNQVQQHNLSLQDVEALVYPTESAEERPATAVEDQDKVLGFRLIPSEKDYVDPKHANAATNRVYQATPGPVMENFFKWGGFHSEGCLELPSKQFGADQLFNPKEVQPNIRMRAALKLCEVNRKQTPLVFGLAQRSTTSTRPESSAPTPVPSETMKQAPSPVPVPESAATPAEEPSNSPKTRPQAKNSTSVVPPLDTTPPPIPEVKKPQLSLQQERALAGQLKAARELRKSTAAISKLPSMNIPPSLALPTRRKQAKPRSVRNYIEVPKAIPKPGAADEKASDGGVLATLWSFVGRKS